MRSVPDHHREETGAIGMDRAKLVEQVKIIVNRETKIPLDDLTSGSRLGDFDIDSLDILKLALAFEKTFSIELAPAELAEVETFDDVIAGIEGKLTLRA
jgi:acyl carrier protein